MKSNFRRNISIGIAPATFVLLAMVTLANRNVRSFNATSKRVLHPQEIREILAESRSRLKDVETANRGLMNRQNR